MVPAMSAMKLVRLGLMVGLALPLAASVGACSGGKSAKTAEIKAGELPAGGDWTGVYYSQVEGHLHLIAESASVSGAWRTVAGDTWGEMSGKLDGNLMKFEWTTHKIGLVGGNATASGKGYFVYSAPKAGESHEIHGEYGLGADEVGTPWDAVKQPNVKPNPASVKPDEVESHTGGGGWDDEGGGGGGEEKKDKDELGVDADPQAE
jgi:hypothetical protein